MLGNKAQEIEKQDTPQKSKTIDPSDLRKTPSVSTTPAITSPLGTRNPIEADFFGAKGALSEGIVALDPTSKLSPSATRKKYAAMEKEQKIAKSQRIRAHLEEIEKLNGKVSEVLTDVKDDLFPIERSRMNEVIESLRDKKYQEYDILVESGPYGGVYYRVLDIVMEKSKNGEELTQLENDILNAAAYMMGGKSSRHLLAHPALHKRTDWIEAKKSDPNLKSPYSPHFKSFTIKLLKILTQYNLISRPDIKLLDEICKGSLPTDSRPSRILERMEKGDPSDQYFNLDEEIFDIFYIRLERYILSSLPKRSGESALNKVENMFEYYSRISGFDIYNKFYRPTRLIAYRISEELRKLGVINSCHLSEVDNLVKDHLNEIFDFESIFNKGKQQVNWIPDSDTISDFVKTILKAAQIKLELVNPTQSTRIYNILSTNIGNIQEDYLDFLINAKDGLGLLSDYPSSPRRLLVHDIIISLAKYDFFAQILKRDEPLKLISIILFGHKSPLINFLNFKSRPRPDKILSLYFPFTTDIIKKFDKLDLAITFKQMKSLQEDIYEDIKTWIFSNPYNYEPYINENPIRGFKSINKSELFPEYDFVVAVWLMNAIHQNKKDLLFSELKGHRPSIYKKLLKNSDPLRENVWRDLMHGMLDIYKTDSSLYPDRAVIYRKCIKEAIKYAKLRGFSFSNPKRPAYHKALFSEEYVVAYNVIMELVMFHGIDPIDFRMVKDESFSKKYPIGSDKFARHEPFGYSLSPFSQVLTTFERNLGIHKTLTKPQQRVAINLFKQLMIFEKRDAQGNLLNIDHTDIIRIYGKQNSWIYKRWGKGVWHKDPEFQDTLKTLNHLRREIRQKSIDRYLKDNWKVAYNRFWVNDITNGKSKCDMYYLIYELEGLGDDNLVQDILSIDFGQLFGNLLSGHGYPVRL